MKDESKKTKMERRGCVRGSYKLKVLSYKTFSPYNFRLVTYDLQLTT